MIAESLIETHPTSPYLTSLNSEITKLSRSIELFNTLVYADFPEITMNDMYGKKHSLSQMKGEIILLDFWSPEVAASNRNNVELKEIHKEQEKKGSPFKVYQVGVTNNKTLWIDAVQNQRLPWTSVSDLKGNRTTALGLYNITQLPANI